MEELPPNLEQVKEYILNHWDGTVRSTPRDEGSAIAVPHPYTVPSLKDSFQELYYWDLYFTSLGLLLQGREELAVGNTLDLMSLVERFGFVPNGNRTFYLNRSQLPLMGPLIALVAAGTKNPGFALEAAPALEREYEFWTTKRLSPTGLSCSGNQATRQELIDFYPVVAQRIGIAGRPPEECLEILSHTMAECEIWDFTPRFNHTAKNFCAIDLNSYLYTDELLLAAWSKGAARSGWQDKARQRRQRLNELCWNEEKGGFFDYDFVGKKQGSLVTAAALQPLWSGLATERQATLTVEKILPQLEFPYGVSAGALPEKPHRVCQWDYPNAWPPLQHVAYRGLQRYGYLDEARRIARKYVESVCRGFETTGDLWEKYNAANGTTKTINETGYLISTVADLDLSQPLKESSGGADHAVRMMGWTAGVFLDALAFLEGEPSFWLMDPQYQLEPTSASE